MSQEFDIKVQERALHTIAIVKKYNAEISSLDLAVNAIAQDINDRGGIKHEWQQIESDIIEEDILPTWKSIIEECLSEQFNQLKSQLEERDKKIRELEAKLENEYSDCIDLIKERDFREEQIDKICDTLGSDSEWSNLNDRGEECLELIQSLKQQLEEKDALLTNCREAFERFNKAFDGAWPEVSRFFQKIKGRD